ncbi:hypothetical protein GOODEAATRI_005372, partial [Goodea atripinnis]
MLLGRHEEDALFRYYERRLLDFCNAFKPAMPKSVVVGPMSCFLQCSPNPNKELNYMFLTSAGYSHHVLQEILPEQL